MKSTKSVELPRYLQSYLSMKSTKSLRPPQYEQYKICTATSVRKAQSVLLLHFTSPASFSPVPFLVQPDNYILPEGRHYRVPRLAAAFRMTASHSGEEADVPSRQGRCQGEGTTSPPLAKEPVRRRPNTRPLASTPTYAVLRCTRARASRVSSSLLNSLLTMKMASGWSGDPSVCEGL